MLNTRIKQKNYKPVSNKIIVFPKPQSLQASVATNQNLRANNPTRLLTLRASAALTADPKSLATSSFKVILQRGTRVKQPFNGKIKAVGIGVKCVCQHYTRRRKRTRKTAAIVAGRYAINQKVRARVEFAGK